MLMADEYYRVTFNRKKLTKHVSQPGKSSLQMDILPGFCLLFTSL